MIRNCILFIFALSLHHNVCMCGLSCSAKSISLCTHGTEKNEQTIDYSCLCKLKNVFMRCLKFSYFYLFIYVFLSFFFFFFFFVY